MKIDRQKWNSLGITSKFSLAFTLMLAFMMLIAATGYFSLFYLGKTEHRIRKSTAIGQLVLEMDRGLEKARRLHGNFFLQYQTMGLQVAHEEYAQPSVREIAQVITKSNSLKKLLFTSNTQKLLEIDRADINLYLSSAKRFASTSIEAVELISKRAAPEWGLEAQLKGISLELQKELRTFPELWLGLTHASSHYKDYLVSRQHFLMQSSLNELNELVPTITQATFIPDEKKSTIFDLFDSFRILTKELLEVDLAISGKLHDFSLQDQLVSPLSKKLIQLTQKEVEMAEVQIVHVHRVAGIIMLSLALLAACVVIYIAMLMHKSVTINVLKLTEAAGEFSEDNLDIRVQTNSKDELGRLGDIFNKMAARTKDLIENLEKKVALRTAELSASEQRFRNLVDDLPKIAVQGYDNERKVIYWNRASETLYGYSDEEAIGKKLEELILPEPMQNDGITAIHNWHQKGIKVPSSELILKNKDGSDVPVYSSHVMLTDHRGTKTMYCVDIDLADLKMAQEASRKSELFYRQLFAHSTSGVAVYEVVDDGQDFIFKDINTAGEKISRINRDDLLGKKVRTLFPGIDDFGLLDVFRKVWQTGKPEFHPFSHYKDDRIERWCENRVYKLPTGEIVAVYEDITDKKQVELERQAMELRLQRAQKMEAIGLMAGGVAHDLNNILSAVVGYPELLLLDLPKDSELRQPLEATKEAGERATAVVADLLTVARGIASSKEPKDLNVLVREYLESPEFLKLQAAHPHIEFNQKLADPLPAVLCSAVHVKKSIMNLVINGAEATGKTGSVILSTTSHSPDRQWAEDHGLKSMDYVVLTVSDTGKGLEEKDLEHIFEPFYTKKVMGNLSGTGLGLSVVWNTMQDHQGTVIVSRNNDITSFELYFPTTHETIIPAGKKSRDMSLQGKGETILVVDDEPQQRNLAKKMLKTLGYKVECLDSGENALVYLLNNRVDLVLLDMLMGSGINGRRTYEQMIKINPKQRAVIVSGFSESEEVKAALALGAGGFIQKPYSLDQLGRMVKKVLSE